MLRVCFCVRARMGVCLSHPKICVSVSMSFFPSLSLPIPSFLSLSCSVKTHYLTVTSIIYASCDVMSAAPRSASLHVSLVSRASKGDHVQAGVLGRRG